MPNWTTYLTDSPLVIIMPSAQVQHMLVYLAFCACVGMFAHVRRNRNGFGWGALCLAVSPLFAGIAVAILPTLDQKQRKAAVVNAAPTPEIERSKITELAVILIVLILAAATLAAVFGKSMIFGISTSQTQPAPLPGPDGLCPLGWYRKNGVCLGGR